VEKESASKGEVITEGKFTKGKDYLSTGSFWVRKSKNQKNISTGTEYQYEGKDPLGQ